MTFDEWWRYEGDGLAVTASDRYVAWRAWNRGQQEKQGNVERLQAEMKRLEAEVQRLEAENKKLKQPTPEAETVPGGEPGGAATLHFDHREG